MPRTSGHREGMLVRQIRSDAMFLKEYLRNNNTLSIIKVQIIKSKQLVLKADMQYREKM